MARHWCLAPVVVLTSILPTVVHDENVTTKFERRERLFPGHRFELAFQSLKIATMPGLIDSLDLKAQKICAALPYSIAGPGVAVRFVERIAAVEPCLM